MNLIEKSVMFIATGCFAGKIPYAPGTFGSVVGLGVCFFLSRISLPLSIVFLAVFILFAVFTAHKAENILKTKDPGCIVIDEMAGMMLMMTGLPFNLISALFGFIIFRIFDICKPFPIKIVEKRLSGGAGIVLDDLVAGIYANIVLRTVLFTADAISSNGSV